MKKRKLNRKCLVTISVFIFIFQPLICFAEENAEENVETEYIVCPNPVINYMNDFQDYQRCYRIFLPINAEIISIKQLKGITNLVPAYPSSKAVEVVYSQENIGKKVKKSRVYVYGLDMPNSWNEREPE